MPQDTALYTIEISEHARRKLDSDSRALAEQRYLKHHSRLPSDPVMLRSSLKPLFHRDYRDARSDRLVKIRAWSINERKFKTTIRLTPKQVASVLSLSQEHDIDPKPFAFKTVNPSPRGTVRYLLGTFLDAVILGYLIPKERDND